MTEHQTPLAATFRAGLIAALTAAGAAAAAGVPNDLGSIAFPTSGSGAAQEHFLHGVLALHSFEYRDARDAFQAAQEAEPDFAMAYWGEAMTYNHPIWLEEEVAAARAALERLAPSAEERAAKAPTARERAYLESVEILFGDGDKAARDQAYADALLRITERFPDDLEARSFYALALLGTCHQGRDVATYMKAAAVVEEVFDRNPRHPGAVHYLIHAYDDPVHAPLGLRPARIYAGIAPAAGHALHMPSHIFLALGDWDATVASNIDSWEAVLARTEAEGAPVDRRNYHALYWWTYAELQRGRFAEARRLLELMAADAEESGSKRTRTHLALMRAAYLVETGRPEGLPAAPDLDGLSPSSAAAELLASGLAALAGGRRDEAVENHRQLAALSAGGGRDTTVSGGYTRVGPARTAEAEVMALELEASIALADGEAGRALELMGRAVETARQAPFGFGPPNPIKPAHELLGEMLLLLERPDEARHQFEQALARAPQRARALLGLARAAAASGDPAAAEASYAALRGIWHLADADLPERAEVGLDDPRRAAREATPAGASER